MEANLDDLDVVVSLAGGILVWQVMKKNNMMNITQANGDFWLSKISAWR
jgi:hypothetical protein